ncbi:hypothetical protein BAE44_0014185 [Dichanthelium oligosanthes]|uniref:DUF295 domain-containing protein n=1 Tax=Dichanthelium oligosanthes TaxID=888268 RepID=A0A1E5VI88_9POAL|nr:hypothetical protein BAE44_0014185 [Dichanthelium oligosanthes]
MACTLPRQKRARLAQPVVPDWSSPIPDLVRRVGDCLLATDDIDCYMAFRAVCHHWRSAIKDDDCADPGRLQPSKWALLDRRDDVLTLANVDTGRFLRRRIPLLRDYFFVGATAGDLILLGEPAYPYQARVLNPFTGSLAPFKAPVPVGEAREVAVTTTSPTTMMVFISTTLAAEGAIMWADQNSEYFQKCNAPFPDDLLCTVPFAGYVYFTNRQGSVLSTAVDDDDVAQG